MTPKDSKDAMPASSRAKKLKWNVAFAWHENFLASLFNLRKN